MAISSASRERGVLSNKSRRSPLTASRSSSANFTDSACFLSSSTCCVATCLARLTLRALVSLEVDKSRVRFAVAVASAFCKPSVNRWRAASFRSCCLLTTARTCSSCLLRRDLRSSSSYMRLSAATCNCSTGSTTDFESSRDCK